MSLLPPNIVIVGAWRSGTTLMFFLFRHGFEDVITAEAESFALETELPGEYRWRVSKKPNDAHDIDRITEKLDPYFIWMQRDPRDCIVSWKQRINDYHLNFKEWRRNNDCIEQAKSTKIIPVRYERFVLNPDATQKYMMAHIPGLMPCIPFSRCHEQIDPNNTIVWQLNGIRPISGSSIGNWRKDKARILDQLEKHPDMQDCLVKYGYETNDNWQRELHE